MTLDELESQVVLRLRAAKLETAVTRERSMLVDLERLVLERELAAVHRYLRITPVAQLGPEWDFEVLFGQYGSPDAHLNFDGRRGGKRDYILSLIEDWLIKLLALNDLPMPPFP